MKQAAGFANSRNVNNVSEQVRGDDGTVLIAVDEVKL